MKTRVGLVLVGLFGLASLGLGCERTCPAGSWLSEDGACLYELRYQKEGLAIQGEELRVYLPPVRPSPQTYQGPYTFWFVQEARENQPALPLERIGAWGLQIQQAAEGFSSSKVWPKMKLRWRLRDRRVRLRDQETIRLALTWLQNARRHVQILPGTYHAPSHLVEAEIPNVQGASEIILYPVRKNRSIAGLFQGTSLAKNESPIPPSGE